MDNQGTVFQLKQTGGNWVLQTLASGLDYPKAASCLSSWLPLRYDSGGQCFSGYSIVAEFIACDQRAAIRTARGWYPVFINSTGPMTEVIPALALRV